MVRSTLSQVPPSWQYWGQSDYNDGRSSISGNQSLKSANSAGSSFAAAKNLERMLADREQADGSDTDDLLETSITQDSLYDGGGNSSKHAESEVTSTRKPGVKERVYYADWLRALAIILVIFVHALVNSFDASGLQPEDVPTIQEKKDGIIKSLVQIGIPMFFYISGIGSTFFRTEEKHFGIFIGEKALRLLVPFVVAIFIFLIPRLYFGQQYEDFCRPDGEEIEQNYWEFMAKTLPTVHLKLSWLWYLPALFIDFMLCYPLLRWTVRRSQRIPFDPVVDIAIILH